MEQLHKDVLLQKRVYLVENLDTLSLLNHLLQDKILSKIHYDQIKSHKTPGERSEELLDILEKRGPKAYKSLLKALKETNAWWIANAIEEKERYPFQYILPVSSASVNQTVVTFARTFCLSELYIELCHRIFIVTSHTDFFSY